MGESSVQRDSYSVASVKRTLRVTIMETSMQITIRAHTRSTNTVIIRCEASSMAITDSSRLNDNFRQLVLSVRNERLVRVVGLFGQLRQSWLLHSTTQHHPRAWPWTFTLRRHSGASLLLQLQPLSEGNHPAHIAPHPTQVFGNFIMTNAQVFLTSFVNWTHLECTRFSISLDTPITFLYLFHWPVVSRTT